MEFIMKKLSFVVGVLFCVGSLMADSVGIKPMPRSVSPIVSPLPVQHIKEFVPIKQEFRQIRATELPRINGQLNKIEIVLNVSGTSSEEVSCLNTNQKRNLMTVITQLKRKDPESAQKVWQSLVLSLKGNTVPVDLNSLISFVLRDSYLKQNKDLYFYTSKVKHLSEKKKELRSYVKDLRDMRRGASVGLASDMDEMITKLEDDLQTIGDDAQLAMLDLQNALNRQAQLMQMMSNMCKMMHDTAMAIIRNMR
jgi:hypothetical protein